MRHGTRVNISVALWLCAAFSGCDDGATAPADPSQARSQLARVTAPLVSAEDAARLADDDRAFAVDLYQALRAGAGNLAYAPASVSIALAMLYGGAAGTTATETASALHFGLPPERLHPAFDALDLALGAPAPSAAGFQLSVANTAWGQKGYAFLPTYLDLLATSYGAGLQLADFTDPETARSQINRWVSDRTQARIPELLGANVLDPLTTLVLTNAVYFKADWAMPFSPKTPTGTFHAPGADVQAPMMRGPMVAIWSGPGWTAAALPYVGGTATMIVVVPDAGTFDTFEAGLTAGGLKAILDGQGAAPVGGVTLPRFKAAAQLDLVETLKTLGMQAAFSSGAADLSGIDGTRHLFVKKVVHQATVAVDEQGTEAAAATAVVIDRKSAPLVSLAVDRPFLFLIRHDPTDAILFQGRVVDPTM